MAADDGGHETTEQSRETGVDLRTYTIGPSDRKNAMVLARGRFATRLAAWSAVERLLAEGEEIIRVELFPVTEGPAEEAVTDEGDQA